MSKSFFWLSALLMCIGMAVVSPVNAAPTPTPAKSPSNYGAIVSQTYDKAQQVTETHLANGLTILTKESHAAPVVYNSVWYRVGSRNEISGRTGLSHILEHMMFKGTKDLPPGSIDYLFLTNGGQINASTAEDRTEYHELIAADRLELALRVEADRMENSAFDPTQLKHEMVVVRSELEGDNNSPDYDLFTNVFLPAVFTSHPYHWPTIGWTEDVEAAAKNRSVIYNYYKEHYMPNNAVVVLVGDFETKNAVALCQKYFGVYPAGNLETHNITPELPQRGERRVVLSRPGSTGQVLIGYHIPKVGTPDYYAFDVISQILSGGRSARLYQDMIETGTATAADGGNADHVDPYFFMLEGTPSDGVTNEAVEKGLEAEVTKLQTTAVTSEELTRAVSQISASFTFNNDSVTAQADQLGSNEIISSYHYLDNYLDKIAAVTPAEIQRVAQTYFTPMNRTVAYFNPTPLPPGQTAPPAAGEKNFGAITAITDPKQKAMMAALAKKYNITSSTAAPGPKVMPTRTVLPNGMTVIVYENHSNHTVAISGYLRSGSMYDPADKHGLASFTAQMLNRGTTTKSALQLALELERVGAGVGFSPSTEETTFGGNSLSKDFSTLISTTGDEIQNPSFPMDQLERLRSQALSSLEEARQNTGGTSGAGTLAEIAFAQATYPKNHPYWSPSIDEMESAIKSLTQSDLENFYHTYYRPDTTVLVIVGDVKTADALATVKATFGGWEKPSDPAPAFTIPAVPLPDQAPPAQLIAIPGTPQTSLLWGYPGQLTRNSPDFYAANIMNYILGGDPFGSRLGKTIRDENGLAYTVYSNFEALHGAGPFEVFIGSNPNNANRAIQYLKQVANEMRKSGVTADEVQHAKAYLTGSYPLRLETNAGIAGQLMVAEDYKLGLDYLQKHNSYINGVTVGQVNASVQKYLRPDRAVLIISGAKPN